MGPTEAAELPQGPQNQSQDHQHANANREHLQYTTKLSTVLPHEMIGRPQWVCWRYELRDGKRTKVPYDAKSGRRAKSSCGDKNHKGTRCGCAQKTWSTFDQTAQAYTRGGYDGVGIVLAGGLGGTDIDDCRNPETGAIETWALALIERHGGGMIEASPSGTGVHIFWLGTLPKEGKKTAYETGAVEMYAYADGGRFFTVTGDLLSDPDATLAINQEAVNAIHADVFPAKAAKTEVPARTYAPLSMDDTELLTRARNNPDPAKAARFIALFDRGDISGYKSASEADAALCNDLAYMCGPSGESRVADLFRRSALYREKVDRDDYLTATVALAYDGRTAFYQPRTAPIPNHVEKETEPCVSEAVDSGELARLRTENARLKSENAALIAANRSLNERLQWERDVKTVSNKIVGASTRETASLLRRDLERTQAAPGDGLSDPDEDGFWRVDTVTVGKRYGVSSSTISGNIAELKLVGALETKEWKVQTSRGPRPRLSVRLAPNMFTPKAWERADGTERDQGGARENAGRKPCQKCGSIAAPVERHGVVTLERPFVETVCPDCGDILKREYTSDAVEVGKRHFPGSKIPNHVEKETSPAPAAAKHDAVHDCGSNHIVPSFENPGLNHHDERAEVLALAESLGWQTRIPAGIENVGGTLIRWQDFTEHAENTLIDEALHSLRIRAQAYQETAVS